MEAKEKPVTIVNPAEFGQAVVAALGLDAEFVTGLTLEVAAGEVPRIEVTIIPNVAIAGELVSELHRYRLVDADAYDQLRSALAVDRLWLRPVEPAEPRNPAADTDDTPRTTEGRTA